MHKCKCHRVHWHQCQSICCNFLTLSSCELTSFALVQVTRGQRGEKGQKCSLEDGKCLQIAIGTAPSDWLRGARFPLHPSSSCHLLALPVAPEALDDCITSSIQAAPPLHPPPGHPAPLSTLRPNKVSLWQGASHLDKDLQMNKRRRREQNSCK